MGKELKHLNRRELVDVIYQLKKSEQILQTENEQLRRQLEEKRIALTEAGSVAEAALALEKVFSTAQDAADVYLAEIEQRRKDIERDYHLLIDAARKKSDSIIQQATEQRDALVAEAKKAYALYKRYEAAIEKKKKELALYNHRE